MAVTPEPVPIYNPCRPSEGDEKDGLLSSICHCIVPDAASTQYMVPLKELKYSCPSAPMDGDDWICPFALNFHLRAPLASTVLRLGLEGEGEG